MLNGKKDVKERRQNYDRIEQQKMTKSSNVLKCQYL